MIKDMQVMKIFTMMIKWKINLKIMKFYKSLLQNKKEAYGFVAKVRSKFNSKIFAMKIIFDFEFVKINKGKCYLLINNKIAELIEKIS